MLTFKVCHSLFAAVILFKESVYYLTFLKHFQVEPLLLPLVFGWAILVNKWVKTLQKFS